MDTPLLRAISNIQTLARIRNVSSTNPATFKLANTISGIEFTVVGAITEPSASGIPLNSIWVVLDPSSAYYLTALRLVSASPPSSGSGLAGLSQTWSTINNYLDIFAYPQTYQYQSSLTPINYAYIVAQVIALLP
jgi:hypothetical protein